MAAEQDSPSPTEQVAQLYDQVESQAAKAGERLVGSGGFASLLGQLAENTAALTKLANDGMDQVLRNLRLASRRDVIRLSRQLRRTEDKLERVLQEIERLQDQLAEREAESPAPARRARGSSGANSRGKRSGRTNGSGAGRRTKESSPPT